MLKAKRLSNQVSLIGHNDIVEMLHRPIYLQIEKNDLNTKPDKTQNCLENRNI
jgi:hypothetical protein